LRAKPIPAVLGRKEILSRLPCPRRGVGGDFSLISAAIVVAIPPPQSDGTAVTFHTVPAVQADESLGLPDSDHRSEQPVIFNFTYQLHNLVMVVVYCKEIASGFVLAHALPTYALGRRCSRLD